MNNKTPTMTELMELQSNTFVRYVQNILLPAIAKKSDKIDLDIQSGTIGFDIPGNKFFVFATPFFDGNDGIPVTVFTDDPKFETEEGMVQTVDSNDMIHFPIAEMTMDVNRDVERYFLTIKLFILNKWKVSIDF